jgi:hypothetical protein
LHGALRVLERSAVLVELREDDAHVEVCGGWGVDML